MKNKKNKKGQSLFEVVLALSIMALIIFAVVILAAISIRNSDFSKNKAVATRYSQGATEWLRGQRDASWSTFSGKASLAGRTWCFNTEPITAWPGVEGGCSSSSFISGTNFQRQVSLLIVGADTVQASVSLYWADAQGTHQVSSITNFTNFRAK